MTTSSTPDRGRALLMSTAAASFVLSAALVAGPALAANECGTPSAGSVTCTGDHPTGITYAPTTDLTVVNNGTSEGPITVTGGSGASVEVNNSGAVSTGTTSATGGIGVTSAVGNATILTSGPVTTTANNTPGLFAATGGAGNVSITATGAVSTTGTSTDGGTPGSNSDGVVAETTGSGSTTVNVTNVTASGAGSWGVLAENTGSGPVNVTVAQNGSVTAAGNGVAMLAGPTSTETLTNYGTITAGTNAYSVITAAGGAAATINNMAGGTLNGPISLNGGLPGGGNTVYNAGTWNVSGTSTFGPTGTTNVLNNVGTIAVAPGVKGAPTSYFAGLTTFNNAGGVVDTTSGNSLNTEGAVFNGGNGSTLRVNANSDSGVLTLASTGTGATNVVLADIPGTHPAMNLVGETLVNGPLAGTGPAGGSFTLGGPGSMDQNAGFVDYRLVFNPATATSSSSYVLFGLPGPEVFEALNTSYALQDFWRHSAFTVTQRQMSIRDSQVGQTPSRAEGWEFWAIPYGGDDYFKRPQVFQFAGFSFPSVGNHNDFVGLQIGAENLSHFGSGNGFWGLGVGGAGTGYWGFTGGVEQQTTHFPGDDANNLYSVGGNVGLYGGATWGGFYVNALGKVDFDDMNTNFSTAGFSPTNIFKAYGVRGEAGYRWPWEGFYVEPSARVSAIWEDDIDLHPAGALIRLPDGSAGVYGEAGGRVGTTFNFGKFFPGPVAQFNPFPGQFNIYFGAWWADQWDGHNDMTFTTFGGVHGPTTIGLAQATTGTFIHTEYGLETADWYGGLKMFLKGENNFDGDSVGGWSAQMGVRFSF